MQNGMQPRPPATVVRQTCACPIETAPNFGRGGFIPVPGRREVFPYSTIFKSIAEGGPSAEAKIRGPQGKIRPSLGLPCGAGTK